MQSFKKVSLHCFTGHWTSAERVYIAAASKDPKRRKDLYSKKYYIYVV
jgi:hypothetical protein